MFLLKDKVLLFEKFETVELNLFVLIVVINFLSFDFDLFDSFTAFVKS
jgi:hypothetical protein